MADDPKFFDKRVAHRYLRKGLLDEKEYRRHLESLPDLAERAEDVQATFEAGATPRPPGIPAPSGANGVPADVEE
jgi:hypothetical protein